MEMGRSQTFLKNTNMFFASGQKHTKGFSWIYLPFAIFSDLSYLFEPIFISYILIASIINRDFFSLSAAFAIMSFILL